MISLLDERPWFSIRISKEKNSPYKSVFVKDESVISRFIS
ncbi:Hypothetical protein Eab7_0455 [Exiguobacterium antarcticum B7]|nr:Hypothetical protein Eab7_0455 [Exiguobacterium antarcticum B7]